MDFNHEIKEFLDFIKEEKGEATKKIGRASCRERVY